jgi:hypothetical protein
LASSWNYHFFQQRGLIEWLLGGSTEAVREPPHFGICESSKFSEKARLSGTRQVPIAKKQIVAVIIALPKDSPTCDHGTKRRVNNEVRRAIHFGTVIAVLQSLRMLVRGVAHLSRDFPG